MASPPQGSSSSPSQVHLNIPQAPLEIQGSSLNPRTEKTSRRLVTSVEHVQRLVSELGAEGNYSLDICFCFDATGSMERFIDQVTTCIRQIAEEINTRAGMKARFALVVYRDYSEGKDRLQTWEFQSADEMAVTLSTVKCFGGGDGAEDCFGGLWAAASLATWKALSRIVVWMGDAPQHGSRYYVTAVDDYPAGDPDGLTPNAIFYKLNLQNIRLVFCKITDQTDKMIEELHKEADKQGADLLLDYKLEGDMRAFLLNTLTTALARTVINEEADLGPKKEYVQVPATFEMGDLWRNEEIAVVTPLKPVSSASPITEIIRGERRVVEEKPRNITLRTTLNPADCGEMRIVYYAMATDEFGQPLPDAEKCVVKESKYEGSQNSREALLSQASMQTTAASLAREYTLQLHDVNIQSRLNYVPVNLVHVENRPVGRNWLTMEPFIEGDFVKFTSNNGQVDKQLEANHPAVGAFSHFTYCRTEGMLMVTDLQGVAAPNCVYTLTDPAIHTADKRRYFPDPTNLGAKGMSAFFMTHECGTICKKLCLKRPEEMNPVERPKKKETSSCACWVCKIY